MISIMHLFWICPLCAILTIALLLISYGADNDGEDDDGDF